MVIHPDKYSLFRITSVHSKNIIMTSFAEIILF